MSKPKRAYIWQVGLLPEKYIVKTGLLKNSPTRFITKRIDEAIQEARKLADEYVVLDCRGNEIGGG